MVCSVILHSEDVTPIVIVDDNHIVVDTNQQEKDVQYLTEQLEGVLV